MEVYILKRRPEVFNGPFNRETIKLKSVSEQKEVREGMFDVLIVKGSSRDEFYRY